MIEILDVLTTRTILTISMFWEDVEETVISKEAKEKT